MEITDKAFEFMNRLAGAYKAHVVNGIPIEIFNQVSVDLVKEYNEIYDKWVDENSNGELKHFEKRYKNIILNGHGQHERAVRLAEVMTEMEHHYRIPLVGQDRMEKFEQEHPDVWSLYFTISASRR